MDSRLEKFMKRYPCVQLATGNIRTCPVRLSFPSLFSKTSFEGSEPKYSTVLLFPRGADMTVLYDAAKKTAADAFAGKSGGLHNPFRDQGEKGHVGGYEKGAIFMTVSSKQRPGIVGPDGKPLVDEEDVYAGCWALVTVRPFSFDAKVKKGVSFGLQNVQKIADDEPFAGGASAEEEFEAIDTSLTGEDAFAAAGAGKAPYNFD